MNKREITIPMRSLAGKTLNLGYVGENLHTRIIIDCTEELCDYPNATINMAIRSPHGDIYPVQPEKDGWRAIWDVTGSDLVYAGSGQIQVTLVDDEEIIKSAIGNFTTSASLETTGPAPEPLQNWMDDANAVLAEIEDMTVAASGLPAGSTPTATISDVSGHKHIAFAIPQGAKGDPGDATIDDTAGDGDTTKVWSADKTFGELSDVKSALNALDGQVNGSDSRTEDVSSSVVWVSGKSVVAANGTYYTDPNRSAADIPLNGANHVSGYTRAGQENTYGLCFLDSNGTWISGDYHAGASTYDWNYSFDVQSNAATLRISCGTAYIPQFTCVLTFGASDGLVKEIEDIKSEAEDQAETIRDLSDTQDDLIQEVDALDEAINGGESSERDLTSSATWSESGYSVNATTGQYVSNEPYSAAQIDVTNISRVYGYTRGGQEILQGMAFVTSDGTFISGDYHASAGTYDWNYDFVVPDNAKYMRISCATARISDFTCTGVTQASSGLIARMESVESFVNDIPSELANFVETGVVDSYSWVDGYRVSSQGIDIASTNYSYACIAVKALQGVTISGFTRASNEQPAFVFYDQNRRYISNVYNPSAIEYNYDYSFTVPSNAAFCKAVCSTAYKSLFTITIGKLSLLEAIRNTHGTNPQNYRAGAFVQALKGDKADFNALSSTRLQDVYDWYDNLVSFFPQNLVRTQIGISSTPTGSYAAINPDTYPIYAYVWTGKNAKGDKKFILGGGLHGPVDTSGDGIQGVIAMAYYIWDLLFNPNKNEYMSAMRDECIIAMVPVLNPWGYQTGYRCNGRGVDCNRNFDYNFVPNAVSYGYTTGTEAFSENETIAIRDFVTNNYSDAKFFCEIHTRGGAVLPDDARWDFVLNTDGTYPGLLTLLRTTGDEMTECYGGTSAWMTHTAENAEPTCYSYFDYVMHIPTYEPEFFRSCNRDEATLDSRGVQVQCVSWYGSMIQTLANHFCGIIT